MARVGAEDVIYDLGSGDARIPITAVEEFEAQKAIGYELREDLCQASLREIKQRNLQDRVKVIRGDFYEADLSAASVVTLFQTSEVNERLRPKLEKELRGGTRVVSLAFKVGNWQEGGFTYGWGPACCPLPITYDWDLPFYYPIYLYIMPDAFK